MSSRFGQPTIRLATDSHVESADGHIYIYHSLSASPQSIQTVARKDAAFDEHVNVLHTASTLTVTACTGLLSRDYDEVRRYGEAAGKAAKRYLGAGGKRPFVHIQAPSSSHAADDYKMYAEASLLAILHELYIPLECREDKSYVAKQLSDVVIEGIDKEALDFVFAVDEGRCLAKGTSSPLYLRKDIIGADPERMTALKTARHVAEYFKDVDSVKVEVVTEDLGKEYPLLAAVARSSEHGIQMTSDFCQFHDTIRALYALNTGRLSKTECKKTSILSVKASPMTPVITARPYTTIGGADVKYGGAMVGMSRDKGGAAAVIGLVATAAILKAEHVNISASVAMVRNSIGSNAYVSDEIIRSRAGVRVRVGNTDAEGRMVMTDLLGKSNAHCCYYYFV